MNWEKNRERLRTSIPLRVIFLLVEREVYQAVIGY